MATADRDQDLRTRANVTGAKRMAITLGAVLVVGLGAWEVFGAHDWPPDITHKQTISGPNAGQGKDVTQPLPGMQPKPENSGAPAAATPSSQIGAGAQ
jgi:hypothetical protein